MEISGVPLFLSVCGIKAQQRDNLGIRLILKLDMSVTEWHLVKFGEHLVKSAKVVSPVHRHIPKCQVECQSSALL